MVWTIRVYDTEYGPDINGHDDYMIAQRTAIQAFVIFNALTRGLELEDTGGTFLGIPDIHCLHHNEQGFVVLVGADGLTYELTHD